MAPTVTETDAKRSDPNAIDQNQADTQSTVTTLADALGIAPDRLNNLIANAKAETQAAGGEPVQKWNDPATAIEDKVEILYHVLRRISSQAIHLIEEELQNHLAIKEGEAQAQS